VRGAYELPGACLDCYASLFTDRAIGYREEHGFDHLQVDLSVGVQKLVRAYRASAGVMFSPDSETGFPHLVVINASWGLGETVVQGSVDPHECRVFKPSREPADCRPIIGKALGTKEHRIVYAKGGQGRTR
jgi:pyruvate,water dikinase